MIRPLEDCQLRLTHTRAVCFIAASFFAASGGALAGDPALQVEMDQAAHAARIRASIEIEAKPETVWAIVTDCIRAPQIVPNLESCRMMQKDPAGRWDVRENTINVFLLPRIRTVMRSDYEMPKRVVFKRIAGDMRISEGEWVLEPTPEGTRLLYSGLFAPNFHVPQFMISGAIRRDIPEMLRNIESASVQLQSELDEQREVTASVRKKR
ncbi:MAG: SRPBCC family protein [Pseudolabrys sp.]|nr:SRPBCC family protein [Pseudolabrys sp.]